MISGREKMAYTGNRACAMKSVTISLMVLLNVFAKFFLQIYTIMDDAMGIVFF